MSEEEGKVNIMGKLILCNGRQTNQPYYFKITNTYIHSIEELCYYIYNYIEIISEDMFDASLIHWMADELQLEDRAQHLNSLIKKKLGLKDYIVCILCSCDYYSEKEMKELLFVLDDWARLSPVESRLKKANHYLKYQQFAIAEQEYGAILNGRDAGSLTSLQRGHILHNIGMIWAHTKGITFASGKFKEAYEVGQDIRSLKQYFYTLYLGEYYLLLQQEVDRYDVKQDLIEEIKSDLDQVKKEMKEFEVNDRHPILLNLIQKGEQNQFYDVVKEFVQRLKEEYRQEGVV